MPKPSHRVLRMILRVFSLLAAIGALLLIFGGRPVVIRLFLNPPETEITTVLLIALKEMGGIIVRNHPTRRSSVDLTVGLSLHQSHFNYYNVAVLLGNGDGTFQAAVCRTTGPPVAGAKGDV